MKQKSLVQVSLLPSCADMSKKKKKGESGEHKRKGNSEATITKVLTTFIQFIAP
jgi:hypothetical protein